MDKPGTHKLSRGFSLIELMLAMLIGLIILGGVMSLYVSTRDTQRSSEDQLTLISNANFVIETIASDLRQAGFWGQASVTSNIFCRADDASCTGANALPAAMNDCANRWYVDLTNAVIASDNANPYPSTCIDSTKHYTSGTDVIGVHYADINTVGDNVIAQHVTYMRSNFEVGAVFVAIANGINGIPVTGVYSNLKYWDPNVSTNTNKTFNYPMVSNLYYISSNTDQSTSDGIPSLHILQLGNNGTQPVMTDTMLISGVVDLQVQFGINTSTTTDDGTVDSYVNPGSVPQKTVQGVTTTDWSRVHSAKIWVLVRSDKPERDISEPSKTITVANNTDTTLAGYRYYLMSSVVQLRNNK